MVDRRHFIFARIIQAASARRWSHAEAGQMEIPNKSELPCRSQRGAANVGAKMLVMEISRRFTAKVLQALLLVWCGLSGSVWAQPASSCKGPAEIEHAIANQPSAAAYDALGAYFGQRNQMACALPAFETAVKACAELLRCSLRFGTCALAKRLSTTRRWRAESCSPAKAGDSTHPPRPGHGPERHETVGRSD